MPSCSVVFKYAVVGVPVAASLLTCVPVPVAVVPFPLGDDGNTPSANTAVPPDFTWVKRLSVGQTVAIRGVQGDVRVEVASGAEVEVTAVRRGGQEDGVVVIAHEHAGGVAVCALYPADGSDGLPGSRCSMDQHVVNALSSDTHVDFHVKLPAGVRLDVRTVEGHVRVSDLRSDVNVSTVGGAVMFEGMRGRRVEATTVSGRIDFSGHLSAGGEYRFTSTSGAVAIGIPRDADAQLTVTSRFGRVRSEYAWQQSVPAEPGSDTGEPTLQTRLGSGAAQLVVHTLSGAITLRKAGRS